MPIKRNLNTDGFASPKEIRDVSLKSQTAIDKVQNIQNGTLPIPIPDNSISDIKIQQVSQNKITTGILSIGGSSNDPIIVIKNNGGTEIARINNEGIIVGTGIKIGTISTTFINVSGVNQSTITYGILSVGGSGNNPLISIKNSGGTEVIKVDNQGITINAGGSIKNSTTTFIDSNGINPGAINGLVPIEKGGTNNSSFTSNRVVYYNGSQISSLSFVSVTTTNSTLTIDGTLKVSSIQNANGTTILDSSGNAVSASKLQTQRTISLTGAVTGSQSFDGSQNISISTTVNHNHDDRYLRLSGGTINGLVTITNNLTVNDSVGITNNLTVGGTITGSLNGNQSSQSKLQTQRTITLSGAVTGSATFDGSQDITISTSVNHNHDDRYYTKTNLQTSGQASVHWNNITNKPTTYIPQTHTHTISEITDISSQSVQNQDKVDGYHASQSRQQNTIPVSDQNGYINNWINQGHGSNLNADKLDGLESTDFVQITGKGVKYTAPTNLQVGWYTIAVNPGNRAIARFGIRDIQNSRHQSVIFYASHHFGWSSEITVLHSSRFNITPIKYIRIKSGGTHDGALLQVYIGDPTNNLEVYLLGDNFQEQGWILKNWIPDDINPGDVRNFGLLIYETAIINLDLIMDGGFATTGGINIVAGSTSSAMYINKSTSKVGIGTTNPFYKLDVNGEIRGTKVWGAVYNDYQEYRIQKEEIEPGYIAITDVDGKVKKCNKDKQRNIQGVVSDVFGFQIGKIDNEITVPIQVQGRVLVYQKNIKNLKIGDQVCSTKDGKVRKMKWWEKILFPEQIVGFVDEIPTYEEWGQDKVKVNGRIWIRVR